MFVVGGGGRDGRAESGYLVWNCSLFQEMKILATELQKKTQGSYV